MFDPLFVTILIASGLIVMAVLTSLLSLRFGAPLLLIFLGLGLIVGEDGLGLQFDNAMAAYFIGSVALAIILFESGFTTRFETISRAAGPALMLSTFGVLATTAFVGVATHLILGLPWLYSLLLGAIVSSTDAAAVFFLLRVGGLRIRERVRATLEVESGSNDPMAVFLTITLVELIVAGAEREAALLAFTQAFMLQIGLGAAMGLIGGWLIARIVNRIVIEQGLYPILLLGLALLLFALTSLIGGSGFLAAYVGGVLAGNMGTRAVQLLRRFQEGVVWLCQIVMFLMLGLLATPSDFGVILIPGLLIAMFLILVGRPLAVWLCLLPFNFTREETAFIAWVGLRGAVSILLALVPIVALLPTGGAFFNIAFIVVLTSLVIQGWTIKPIARRLGLVVPRTVGPVEKVELELPGNAHHELVVYRIIPDSPVASGERLPRWARPSLIVRDGRSMSLHESGRPQPGDFVYIFTAPRLIRLLDRFFASTVEIEENDTEFYGEFSLPGSAPLAEVAAQYGSRPDGRYEEQDLAQFFSGRFGTDIHPGDRVTLGQIELIVRQVDDNDRVQSVGVNLMPQEPAGRMRLPLFHNLREILALVRRRLVQRSASAPAAGKKAPDDDQDRPGAREEPAQAG